MANFSTPNKPSSSYTLSFVTYAYCSMRYHNATRLVPSTYLFNIFLLLSISSCCCSPLKKFMNLGKKYTTTTLTNTHSTTSTLLLLLTFFSQLVHSTWKITAAVPPADDVSSEPLHRPFFSARPFLVSLCRTVGGRLDDSQ